MDFYVRTKQIKYNAWQPLEDLQSLRILWKGETSDYYTLIMYDTDSFFVNTFIVNIPGNEIVKGTQMIGYIPPNPAIGSGRHHYRVSLYYQGPVVLLLKDKIAGNINEEVLGRILPEYGMKIIKSEILVVDSDSRMYYRSPNDTIESNSISIDTDFNGMGIGGLDKELSGLVKQVLISRFLTKSMRENYNVKDVKGILLYGPPGTGKTLIARNIGKLLPNSVITKVNGPELESSWTGETEANIRKIFSNAKLSPNKSHVIIFDEIDAVGRKRSDNLLAVHHDTALTQLLTEIDGLESANNVLIIGITNRKDVLDPALIRSGRIEYHIEIPLPNEQGRKEILEIYLEPLRSKNLVANIDTNKWAQRLNGYSGADIEALVTKAKNMALLRNFSLNANDIKLGNKVNMRPTILGGTIFPIVTDDDLEQASKEIQPISHSSNNLDIMGYIRDNMINKVELTPPK